MAADAPRQHGGRSAALASAYSPPAGTAYEGELPVLGTKRTSEAVARCLFLGGRTDILPLSRNVRV
jgi:hypothetical protein